MAIKTIKHNQIIWHHIDRVDEAAMKLFKDEFKFHPLDIKDVQGESEESKIDVYKDYVFVVLHFPVLIREIGRVGFMELDIFLGQGFLVSVQKGKLKVMRDLYYKIQNSTKMRKIFFGRDAGYLTYKILDVLYNQTRTITNYLSQKLRQLEDEVYGGEVSENTARKIAYLRQKVLALKRIFDPQIEVMSELSKLKIKFLPVEMNIYFDDLDDYIDKVTHFLDNQKYVLKDLLEVHDSLVTHKTNKVIKILTIFSVALLPLTLLAGIYGMNIDLPFASRPGIIESIFLGLMVLILFVVWLMKRKKLL